MQNSCELFLKVKWNNKVNMEGQEDKKSEFICYFLKRGISFPAVFIPDSWGAYVECRGFSFQSGFHTGLIYCSDLLVQELNWTSGFPPVAGALPFPGICVVYCSGCGQLEKPNIFQCFCILGHLLLLCTTSLSSLWPTICDVSATVIPLGWTLRGRENSSLAFGYDITFKWFDPSRVIPVWGSRNIKRGPNQILAYSFPFLSSL